MVYNVISIKADNGIGKSKKFQKKKSPKSDGIQIL